MILNTGSRTDIPAFFSDWFYKRVEEGYVMVRNPFYPKLVTKYRIDPEVVDVLSFCTKNPEPMLNRMEKLKDFDQFWYVTITPYGKEIEPNIKDKRKIMASFRTLSDIVGNNATGWRYDPIFISEKYSVSSHIDAFAKMARYLKGYTHIAVISFIDLYEKTKRNFPEVREVSPEDRVTLGKAMLQIAQENDMVLKTCLEGEDLKPYGVDTSGCLTKEMLEKALHLDFTDIKVNYAREGCKCLLGSDIGAYNTCSHFCRYCYANYDRSLVIENIKKHDPNSPLLIGYLEKDDEIREAKQISYKNRQVALNLF